MEAILLPRLTAFLYNKENHTQRARRQSTGWLLSTTTPVCERSREMAGQEKGKTGIKGSPFEGEHRADASRVPPQFAAADLALRTPKGVEIVNHNSSI